jgi:hypothetical protein
LIAPALVSTGVAVFALHPAFALGLVVVVFIIIVLFAPELVHLPFASAGVPVAMTARLLGLVGLVEVLPPSGLVMVALGIVLAFVLGIMFTVRVPAVF